MPGRLWRRAPLFTSISGARRGSNVGPYKLLKRLSEIAQEPAQAKGGRVWTNRLGAA
jgi:hypothetical protein